MPVVPYRVATACMQEFENLMKGEDLQKIHQAFTSSISFNTPEIAQWLTDNDYLARTQRITIGLGIYTPTESKELSGSEGRITVFIFPEEEGKENDPFNLGTLTP